MTTWDYDVHYEIATSEYYAEIFDCETGEVCWRSPSMASEADCEELALNQLRQLEGG